MPSKASGSSASYFCSRQRFVEREIWFLPNWTLTSMECARRGWKIQERWCEGLLILLETPVVAQLESHVSSGIQSIIFELILAVQSLEGEDRHFVQIEGLRASPSGGDVRIWSASPFARYKS